jgi:hypothetical protein
MATKSNAPTKELKWNYWMDEDDCNIDLPPDVEEKGAESSSVIGFIGTGLSNIFSSEAKEEVVQVPQ